MPPQPSSPKKFIAPIVALIVLIGLIVLGLFSSKQPSDNSPALTDVGLVEWPSEQVKQETISEQPAGYSITAVYPITKGESVSRVLRDFVFETIDSFKKDTTPEEDMEPLPSGLTFSLDIGYEEVKHTTTNTYIFLIHSDTGGAHGLQTTKTFTFDRTGKQITISDLFSSESRGLGMVADYVQKELVKREFADANWIKDGAGPSPENYANFFIDERGVTFLFDPYQVAPYAAGQQQVLVPVTVFQSVANPEIF